jgi:hypothetical protein
VRTRVVFKESKNRYRGIEIGLAAMSISREKMREISLLHPRASALVRPFDFMGIIPV